MLCCCSCQAECPYATSLLVTSTETLTPLFIKLAVHANGVSGCCGWKDRVTHDTLVQQPFSTISWISWYQNVSIPDIIGAKKDGGDGDNWSHKTCKAPIKSSPPTNQHPVFLQARCPSCRPTNSVKALNGKSERQCSCGHVFFYGTD